MPNPKLLIRSSDDTLDTVCARLPDIASRHKFGLLATHDLSEKIRSKGIPFERECRVFEICNPQQAQMILLNDISVSAALPCRISVYSENGKTILASIEPGALLGLFGAPSSETGQAADEVRSTLVKIMEEAARNDAEIPSI